MWKRLIGILVVLVMALSLPMVALAADEDEMLGSESGDAESATILPDADEDSIRLEIDGKIIDEDTWREEDDFEGEFFIRQDLTEEDVHNVITGENKPGWISQGLLQYLSGDEHSDLFVSAIMHLFESGIVFDDAFNPETVRISFSSDSLLATDIVRIVRYAQGGNSWRIIGFAEFDAESGLWWFDVEDFGLWGVFFALIERRLANGDINDETIEEIVEWAWWLAESMVLGEVSPDTGDSSIGMFGMIAIILSSLGVAGFAITRAKKEMAK